MLPEHWRTLQPYVDQALDTDAAGRVALLETLRATQPALAHALQVLLASEEAAAGQGFLEQSPEAGAPNTPNTRLAGQRLGAYVLVQPIGEGGAGSVWLARRDDGRFEGQAAVKLLNRTWLGAASAAQAQRFKRETQILARLAHPHIAHLIDAGVSPTGQAYLVLEWVQGQNIDDHCDALQMGLRERISLFCTLLGAVTHAHHQFVVHRDIKPGNVMVTTGGDVKLLDFGIAKLLATDDELPIDMTQQVGAALTPGYAAPEQWRAGTITAATDVYALGALLHVLLAGRHPMLGAQTTVAMVMKNTLEMDAALMSATSPTFEVSKARGLSPQALRQQLQGDLDNIVAKALQREPAQRYATAAVLADDLQHYLGHRPVLARAPTWRYRLGKLVRRQRVPLALAAAGLVATSVLGTQAWQQQETARLNDARASTVDGLLQSLFVGMSPDVATHRQFTARELLERGQAYLDGTAHLDAATRRAARLRMAALYDDVGAYKEAAGIYADEVAQSGPQGQAAQHSMALWNLANVQVKAFAYDDAKKTLAWLASALNSQPAGDPRWGPLKLLQSEVQYQTGAAASAVLGLAQAQALLASAAAPNLELLARAVQARGMAELRLGNMKQAQSQLQEAVRLYERLGAKGTLYALFSKVQLGVVEMRLGHALVAVGILQPTYAALRQRLGPVHDLSVSAANELAHAHLLAGQFDEMKALTSATRASMSGANQHYADSAALLDARAEMYQGNVAAAEPLLLAQLLARERAYTSPSFFTEPVRRMHAEALLRLHRNDAALAALRLTIARQTQLTHAEHNSVALSQLVLGCALARQGDIASARDLWLQAKTVLLRDLGPDHPGVLVAESYLALVPTPMSVNIPSSLAPAVPRRRVLAERLVRELGWQDGAALLSDWLRSSGAPVRWQDLPVVL